MLEQLLGLVAQGGIRTYEDLAARLSVPVSLVEAMLENLARLGYLRKVDRDCGEHCGGCSAGDCSTIVPALLWSLTEKGARTARRLL